MSTIRYIDKDFVRFSYNNAGGKKATATLVFGDKVELLGREGSKTRIRALELFEGKTVGTVRGQPFRTRDKGVLKFSMVDVQQGDGMIMETPPDPNHQTKIIFVDGGDNKLFARHAAWRYRHRKTSHNAPLDVDLILVTHGDADHFDGLNDIKRSETASGLSPRKRLFIHPKRIYHNGIVKMPSKNPATNKRRDDEEMFGRTTTARVTKRVNGNNQAQNELCILDLPDDPRNAPHEANRPFTRWFKTIEHWEKRGPIDLRRIAFGDDARFDFLGPEIRVEVQGPFTTKTRDPADGRRKPILPFLHKPKKSAVMHLEDATTAPTGHPAHSASHTINGHSIAVRITYGNVRFNLTGDLNKESMDLMEARLDIDQLEAEIVKAPHHGSADFDFSALEKMRPVVSLISSGDESANKEHIHPRATLVGALGKASRGQTPIVLCTELAAFFAKKDYSHMRKDIAKFYNSELNKTLTRAALKKFFGSKRRTKEEEAALRSFFAFERTNFGIIHVRTDGERVLVFTHSGKKGMREAYRFTVGQAPDHRVRFAHDVKTG